MAVTPRKSGHPNHYTRTVRMALGWFYFRTEAAIRAHGLDYPFASNFKQMVVHA